jgi:hypothetical protein
MLRKRGPPEDLQKQWIGHSSCREALHDAMFSGCVSYAGQADAYAEQADADLAPYTAFALSKDAALRPLNINPDLDEAHVSLANALFYNEWKWDDADQSTGVAGCDEARR